MIAYYLHAARPESLDRARAVVAALDPADVVVVSPDNAPPRWPTSWVALGADDPDAWGEWVTDQSPAAVVIDGSTEHVRTVVASDRTVAVVALPGGGTHGELGPAYGAADLILAPWPAGIRDDTWPTAWRERTVHLGAVGWRARHVLGRTATTPDSAPSIRGNWQCLSLAPTAGGLDPRARRELVSATPGWQWTFAGERELLEDGPVWNSLSRAETVVCAPTATNLAALVAARVPAVLTLPDRPTAAQSFLAESALRSAPVVLAPPSAGPDRWRLLLAHARELDGSAWACWCPETALERLGDALATGGTEPRLPRQRTDAGLAPV